MSDFDQEGFDAFLNQEPKQEVQSPAQPQQVAQPEEKPQEPVQQVEAKELPFPNFDKLPAETQKAITERMERLEAARKEKELLAAKYAHEFNALQGRVAPTQRELEAAKKEAAELRRKQEEAARTLTPEQERRRKELAERLPEENELVRAHLDPIQAEIERLRKERETFAEEQKKFQFEMHRNRAMAEVQQYRPDMEQQMPTLLAWMDALDGIDKETAIGWYNTPAASPDVAKNNIRLWRMFERDEALAKEYMAQNEPNPTPKPKPALDVDPNPRNRQPPGAPAVSAYGSSFSDEFDSWLAQTGQKVNL